MLSGTESRMTTMTEGAEARLKAETAVVRQVLEPKLEGVTTTVDSLKIGWISRSRSLSLWKGILQT